VKRAKICAQVMELTNFSFASILLFFSFSGDGGGPLVCSTSSKSEHYYQAGIVVGGVGCGAKDVPGFYMVI
jgi:secreted trypsin-like serine protease